MGSINNFQRKALITWLELNIKKTGIIIQYFAVLNDFEKASYSV